MEHFAGQFWDADHVVFERVTGTLDREVGESVAGATGCFDVHQGGILGGGAILATDREYRLILDDGRTWPVRLTKVRSSNSAGIARIEFRIASDPAAAVGLGESEP